MCGCRWRRGGAGQNRFGSEARGRFCCCICAARFQRFSLSTVGVVALAPATAVQLDVGARRLAVPGGAEEAAPRRWFGSLHPRAVGVGFWLWRHSVPQHLCLRDDGVGDKFVAVLRQNAFLDWRKLVQSMNYFCFKFFKKSVHLSLFMKFVL